MRDRARQGFDFFVGRGYSPEAAGGIMGNFVRESRLNPLAVARGDGSDGSDSIGLGQWNQDRAQNLMKFARANEMNPREFDTQLRFTDWELQHTQPQAREALMAAKTPTEAAAAFVTLFERPKGSDRGARFSHGWDERDTHANAIYNAFGGRPSPTGEPRVQMASLGNAPMPSAPAGQRQAAPQQVVQTGGFEVLDDTPSRLPAPPAQSGGYELLDDEPAPRLTAAQPGQPGGDRPRVRVSLPSVDEATPEQREAVERQRRVGEYERQARADREAQGPILGTLDTAVRGAARAVPFMDDIAAAGRYATGGADSYQDALDQERARNRVDDTDSPVASYGAQIGAGLALPGSALASQGLRGAAQVGAGYGALYGAGQGEGVADRASRAVTGGALGGALGGAASGLISGAGAVGRFAADRASGVTSIARGAMDAEGEAIRRIQAAAQRDSALPGAEPNAQMFAAAREAGQPVMLVDEAGETTRALARSSANTSPEARSALEGAIATRNQGQAERVTDFLQQITGTSGDPAAVREGLRQQARAANRPAYARAYAEGASGLWDEGLQSLTAAPAVQAAIARASRTGANRAVADGFTPPVSPFARLPDGTYALRETADGTVARPSLQFWDHVKRNLDDAFTTAQRKGANSEAADIGQLRESLVRQLDEAAPSYAAARAGAARAFGAQDASEAGERFVTANMTMPDARRAFAALSQPERQLFADGFASALIERVRGLPDRRDVVNSIFASPKARERIDLALGRGPASRLEAFLRVENLMTMTGNAIRGNSTTARQLAELGMAGGGATAGYLFDGSPSTITLGAIMGGLARRGALKVDARVAQRVGEMLSSNDPEVLRRVTEQIGRQPAFMRAVRGTEDWLSANLPKVVQPEAPQLPVFGQPRAIASDDQEQPR